MNRDPLNFFEPFENSPPNHENQLTRALLLVLRLSPIAHEYWLGRTGEKRRLAQLSQPRFNTQRRQIALMVEDTDEPIPLISVFLEPSETFGEGTVVTASDRLQVLDGIIEYLGDLVIVIENKVAAADDTQAVYINFEGANVKPTGPPVHVPWPDILVDLNGILERQLAAGAEHEVLSDFLAYVDDHFPNLGPYQTLGLSGRNEFRVDRRLRAVLAKATGLEARIDKWGPCIDLPWAGGVGKRAYLQAVDGMTSIMLSAYPADTLTQAKEFYARPKAIEAVRNLVDKDGWVVRHNFHFGHMEPGFVWTHGVIDATSYIDLWAKEILQTRIVPRAQWARYLNWLIEAGIATEDDRDEFDKEFTAKGRMSATPRPGLAVSRRWSIGGAEELDASGKFVVDVRDAYEVLAELAAA